MKFALKEIKLYGTKTIMVGYADDVDQFLADCLKLGEEGPQVNLDRFVTEEKESDLVAPKDGEFPWIDKPLQTISEFIGSATSEPSRAIRHDQDKPHMDLLSPIAMFGIAQVMTHGLKKYPGSQWKKGMVWSKVIASLLRHTFKFMAGEDFDKESGLPHPDHIAANATFLQEYFRKHKDLDDRMKTGLE